MNLLTPWTTATPPCPGWWNASTERDDTVRRYWGGEKWSTPCYLGDPDGHAERARTAPAETFGKPIEWRGRTQP